MNIHKNEMAKTRGTAEMGAHSRHRISGLRTATLVPEPEIIAASHLLLTDPQTQGTKVASTVARGGKI